VFVEILDDFPFDKGINVILNEPLHGFSQTHKAVQSLFIQKHGKGSPQKKNRTPMASPYIIINRARGKVKEYQVLPISLLSAFRHYLQWIAGIPVFAWHFEYFWLY
jgi:hypothetical protein